jgi:hypothetical protein
MVVQINASTYCNCFPNNDSIQRQSSEVETHLQLALSEGGTALLLEQDPHGWQVSN